MMAVLLPGDIVALVAFGRPLEVVTMSALALGLSLAWIVLLPNCAGRGGLVTHVSALFLAHLRQRRIHPQNAPARPSLRLRGAGIFACLSLTFSTRR
jgi:hypothetical protein